MDEGPNIQGNRTACVVTLLPYERVEYLPIWCNKVSPFTFLVLSCGVPPIIYGACRYDCLRQAHCETFVPLQIMLKLLSE